MPSCQPIFGLGVRHVQLVLLTWGYLRDMISLKTVLIPNHIDVHSSGEERAFFLSITKERNEYIRWVTTSSRAFGRIAGGVLSLKLNNKYFMLFSSLVTILCESLIPTLSIKLGFTYALVLRGVDGFTEGTRYAPIAVIMSRWIPQREISLAASCLILGLYGGNIITSVINKAVTTRHFASLRYGCATLSFVWALVWIVFGAQDPKTCFYLSEKERKFLYNELGKFRKIHWKAPVPWKPILKSHFFYVILVMLFSNVWFLDIFYKFIGRIALKNKKSPASVGVQASCIFLIFIIGHAGDIFMRRGVPTNLIRKIVISFGFWGTSFFGVLLAFYDDFPTQNVFISIIAFTEIFQHMYFTLFFDLVRNSSGFFLAIATSLPNLSLVFSSMFRDYWHNYSEPTDAGMKSLLYLGCSGLYFANLIFSLSGTIRMLPFDSEGSVDWRKDSILTYP